MKIKEFIKEIIPILDKKLTKEATYFMIYFSPEDDSYTVSSRIDQWDALLIAVTLIKKYGLNAEAVLTAAKNMNSSFMENCNDKKQSN